MSLTQRLFAGLILIFALNWIGCPALWAQLAPGQGALKAVNSPFDEQSPVISPDGAQLYFTIAGHPDNVDGKKDPGDIWVSRRVGQVWSVPVHGGSLLNNRGYNAVAGISQDGTQLFLQGHYDPTGQPARTQGISVSYLKGSTWSRPENIQIPYFQNKSSILSGQVTSDKGYFVFSAETYGTYGVEDMYISRNEDGHWTEPRNLGNKVNTQYQELSPSLSDDGKTLFFSSNGRKGQGSFDIFKAERLDDTWINWSEPVNIGSSVNSEGRELFYSDRPALGLSLYTSTKNSDGYGDIKFFVPLLPLAKKDSTVKTVKLDTASRMVNIHYDVPETGKDMTVSVYGKVTDARTGESIAAKLDFEGKGFNGASTATPQEGYALKVRSKEEYRIKIESNGYISILEKLDIHDYEMNDLEMNFKLQPVEVGTTVNLKSVLFDRGTSNLLPESFQELDVVVSFLLGNPTVKIELSGHTDNRGIHSQNLLLSQHRVDKVKEYLVSKGIAAGRITGKGFGGLKPIASNETEETRRLNRRVEFTIKKR